MLRLAAPRQNTRFPQIFGDLRLGTSFAPPDAIPVPAIGNRQASRSDEIRVPIQTWTN
jgi:hypothetical protein